MKRMKILSALLALTLFCCACSAAAGEQSRTGSTGMAVPLSESTENPGFTDVPAGAWYAEAANWCREHNILTGTTFDAGTAMTRATVADALYRAEGSPAVQDSASFSDVPAGSPYASAAAWASANDVMSGYGGGRFGGEDPVTREQMAAIFWRYAGSPSAEDAVCQRIT